MDGSDEYVDAPSDDGSSDSNEKFMEASDKICVHGQPPPTPCSVPVDGGHIGESSTDLQVEDADLFGPGTRNVSNTVVLSDIRTDPQGESFTDLVNYENLQESTDSSFEVLSHSSNTDSGCGPPVSEQELHQNEHSTQLPQISGSNSSVNQKPPPVPPKPRPVSEKKSGLTEVSQLSEKQSFNVAYTVDKAREELEDNQTDMASNNSQIDMTSNNSQTDMASNNSQKDMTSNNSQTDMTSNNNKEDETEDNVSSKAVNDQNIPEVGTNNSNKYFDKTETENEKGILYSVQRKDYPQVMEEHSAPKPFDNTTLENDRSHCQFDNDYTENDVTSAGGENKDLDDVDLSVGDSLSGYTPDCSVTSGNVDEDKEVDDQRQYQSHVSPERESSQKWPPDFSVPSVMGVHSQKQRTENVNEDISSGIITQSETFSVHTSLPHGYDQQSIDQQDSGNFKTQESSSQQCTDQQVSGNLQTQGGSSQQSNDQSSYFGANQLMDKQSPRSEVQGMSPGNEADLLHHQIIPASMGVAYEQNTCEQNVPDQQCIQNPNVSTQVTSHEQGPYEPASGMTQASDIPHGNFNQTPPSIHEPVHSYDSTKQQENWDQRQNLTNLGTSQTQQMQPQHQYNETPPSHQRHLSQSYGLPVTGNSSHPYPHPRPEEPRFAALRPGGQGGHFMGHGSHGFYSNQRPIFPGQFEGFPYRFQGPVLPQSIPVDPISGYPLQPPPLYMAPNRQHMGWPQCTAQQEYQRYHQQQPQQQQQQQYNYERQQQYQHQSQRKEEQQQQQPVNQIPECPVDKGGKHKGEKESKKTVRVEGIPEDMSSETLELYFTNKRRSGGGDIEEIKMDERKGRALVTFVREEDTQQVVEKKTHTLSGEKLKVFLHDSEEDSSTNTIKVTGFSESVSEETIEMYFESTKRSCGGAILEKKFTKEAAYITFKEVGVAEKVVSKCDHIIQGTTLSVELHKTESAHPPHTLVVTGYSRKLNPDTIQMYFESKKRSGGGENKMKVDLGVMYLTFDSDEVVERILGKCPHTVADETLTVTRADDYVRENSSEAPRSSMTVEVKGYDKGTSEDSISLYFENKRKSGGGEVTDLRRDMKKGVTYITFKSEEVAERVASRSHTFSGKVLQVKLLVPQVMYKDRILLTGVPELTTKESLTNYLEARTQLDVEQVLYGEEEGEVLVSFSDVIKDLNVVMESLTAKPFKQGNTRTVLKASQVPLTTSITVHDLPEKATETLIVNYFENTRKSGGGEVEEVVLNHQEKYAVVRFKDPQVADAVTQRDHTLCKMKVDVSQNYECLGEKGGSPEPPISKLPDPVILSGLNEYVMKHLNKNQVTMDGLQQTMADLHAKINITLDNKAIILTPTFTLGSKEVKPLVKTWSAKVQEKCTSELERIDVQTVTVNSEIWTDVVSILATVDRKRDSELFLEEKDWIIVVSEPSDSLSGTAQTIKQKIDHIKAEYERKKNEVTETMTVNPAKLRLLLAQGILDKLKFSDLKVELVEPQLLSFTGQTTDVQKGKMKILEEMNTIMQQTIFQDFSTNQMQLLKRASVCQFLEKKLEDQPMPVHGSWEPGKEGIIVYHTQEHGVSEVLGFLKTSIKETTQKLDPENLPLLSSPNFLETVETLTIKHNDRIIILPDSKKRQIVITAISQDLGSTESEVRNFIDKNSIYSELYKCDKIKLKFLLLHCKDELETIKDEMKQYCVDFVSEDDVLKIKCTKSGLPHIRRMIHCITQRVTGHNQFLNRPGLKTFLETGSILKEVEHSTRCVITFKESEHSDDSENDEEENPDVTYDISFVCNFDQTKQLHIAVGDLLSLVSLTDAVVVEATPNLGTDSNQAWEVIQKAGEKAVSEVRSFASRSGQCMEGEVFCSSPGNLRCKMIIHAVGPDDSVRQSEVVKAVVITSLEEVQKKTMKSVALPAFNTTKILSPDDALRSIVEAVYTFYEENSNSCVLDVYLCVEDWSTYQLLWDIALDVFGEENVKSNSDEMSTTDSLHGGQRRRMGLRNESMRFQSMREPDLPGVSEEMGAGGGQEIEEQPSPTSGPKMPRPRILLVKADMGVEEADVIVNSSNTNLDLSQGQVSKSLLKNAGPAIQAECRQKYPKGVKMGDIAVTKGGNMQCVEQIYHCTLPGWNNANGKKTFTDTLKALLEKTDKEKWKTLAIPALGTGNLGYSRDLVAKLMYEAVIQFGKDKPETTINDVLFIVYPGDAKTIEAFEAEHKKYVEAAGGRVASSEKERDEERQMELEEYRNKQGYAQKFGEAVTKIAQGAKSMIMGHRDPKPVAPVTGKPSRPTSRPTSRPAAPTPKTGTLARSVSQPLQVPLWIYTDDDSDVKKAVDMIYASWDAKMMKKLIDEESVKSWSQKQVEDLRQVENEFGVEIKVTKATGRISVYGLQDKVTDAVGSIYQMIRKVEKEQQEREYAEELQKLVQWYFVDVTDEGDDRMMEYEKEVNVKLERAYTKEKRLEWTFQGYVFDFDNWVEYPENDPTDQVKMIRRDKITAAALQLPDTWEPMTDKDVQLKAVNNTSKEFEKVQKKFTEALGTTPGQILRLDRIQSKTLYQQYHAKKQQLEKQNPGVTVERSLWHGTNTSATMSISTYGFNRSYCDKEQNAFGEGAYFTTDAGYAARDRYAPADAQGKRYMFMCKVLTGSFAQGKPKIRVPPPKDPNNPQVLHDSVVDDPNNPKTFVIFSDTQAYPEYLISFQ